MYVKVGFHVGTDIDQAAREAIQYVKTYSYPVQFDFNGHSIHVNHISTVETVVEDYHSSIDLFAKLKKAQYDKGEGKHRFD